MSAYFELTNQTLIILAFLLVFTMTLVMIGYKILYPTSTGLMTFILGNIAQLGFFAVLYIDGYSGVLRFSVLVNTFECLAATLWVVSFKKITSVKVRAWFYILLNAATVAATAYYFYYDNSVVARRFVTSLIVAIVLIDGAVTVFMNPSFKKYRSFVFTGTTIVLFAVVNLSRGLYRLFVPFTFRTVFDANPSISLFVTLTLAFAMFMNFSIVFLNMDLLVSQIKKTSNIDPLTGLFNRRYFFERFETMLALLRRKGEDFVVAIVDIDDFKRINDTFGHNVGDEILVEFSDFIREQIRNVDIAARYGGEEFIILLRTESMDGAAVVMDRFQKETKEKYWSDKTLSITFSAGVELVTRKHLSMTNEEIIDIVDKRLYYAKDMGKDMVVYSTVVE